MEKKIDTFRMYKHLLDVHHQIQLMLSYDRFHSMLHQ